MTEHMVQYPKVCGHAGVERIEKLENAIERFSMEGHGMLMVMIPRTDHPFGDDHDQHNTRQPPDTIDQVVNSEVDHAEHDYKQNRNSVRSKSKHIIFGVGKSLIPSVEVTRAHKAGRLT